MGKVLKGQIWKICLMVYLLGFSTIYVLLRWLTLLFSATVFWLCSFNVMNAIWVTFHTFAETNWFSKFLWLIFYIILCFCTSFFVCLYYHVRIFHRGYAIYVKICLYRHQHFIWWLNAIDIFLEFPLKGILYISEIGFIYKIVKIIGVFKSF